MDNSIDFFEWLFELVPDDEKTAVYIQALNQADRAWLKRTMSAYVIFIGSLRLIEGGNQNYIPVATEAAACIADLMTCYRIEEG